MVRNERRQGICKGGLTARRTSANEKVLPLKNKFSQLLCEPTRERPNLDQVFHLESVRTELSNRSGYTVNAARWKHGSNAAPIGEAWVKDGLGLRNVID